MEAIPRYICKNFKVRKGVNSRKLLSKSPQMGKTGGLSTLSTGFSTFNKEKITFYKMYMHLYEFH